MGSPWGALLSLAGLIVAGLSALGVYDLVSGLLHAAGHGSLMGVVVFGFLLWLLLGALVVVFVIGCIGVVVGLVVMAD